METVAKFAQAAVTVADQLPLQKRTGWIDFWRRLFTEKPLGAVGAVIIVGLVLMAIFADFLAPYGFSEQKLSEALQSYSWNHLLGTDQLGRDVFTRVVYGARISLTVGFACVIISIVGAVLIGLISGYFGGKIDATIQRLVDAFMAIPDLVFVLTFMAVFGPGLLNVIIALSVISLIWNSRIVRGEILSLKQNPYIEAAQAMGASTFRVLFLQLLPNAVAPIIVLGTTRIGGYILGEASLSFLGFGVPPPFPTWGGMLSGTGITYMYRAPWLAIWPGLALGITVFAFNMFGDAMRDLLDPRLRGSK
jgi:peptide/nickel transport system permease protein